MHAKVSDVFSGGKNLFYLQDMREYIRFLLHLEMLLACKFSNCYCFSVFLCFDALVADKLVLFGGFYTRQALCGGFMYTHIFTNNAGTRHSTGIGLKNPTTATLLYFNFWLLWNYHNTKDDWLSCNRLYYFVAVDLLTFVSQERRHSVNDLIFKDDYLPSNLCSVFEDNLFVFWNPEEFECNLS